MRSVRASGRPVRLLPIRVARIVPRWAARWTGRPADQRSACAVRLPAVNGFECFTPRARRGQRVIDGSHGGHAACESHVAGRVALRGRRSARASRGCSRTVPFCCTPVLHHRNGRARGPRDERQPRRRRVDQALVLGRFPRNGDGRRAQGTRLPRDAKSLASQGTLAPRSETEIGFGGTIVPSNPIGASSNVHASRRSAIPS
jgi:hypothetical protein